MQPAVAHTATPPSPKEHPTLDAATVVPSAAPTAAPVPNEARVDPNQSEIVQLAQDPTAPVDGAPCGISDDESSDDASDDDDGDGSDADATNTTLPQASGVSTIESTGAQSVVGSAEGTGTARITGRKRPRDPSATAQTMRKRQYVNSVRAIDGVRRHVTVTCTRLAVGGFKCTFTSEHRRLSGALRCQRANAKGGEVIERRHDAFLINGPAGHDAPFPDYDRVRENFLIRGTDICEHVRSELIPTHTRTVSDANALLPPPPPSSADTDIAPTAPASS
ncbi:hypothetical protein psal_cds_163 [Pandoravirus salinus]|uniref:Uncharacterized protein n=1 Tax=Pandoravirus salinus TaxID=1349410 RepID=S4VT59_9VIRU|nr:hypothetical protein psal_cds_163 [Pandoravirus salinus]AGO83644.1 hypothetical protein psal_cds_163 [Pandoravirus salinus]